MRVIAKISQVDVDFSGAVCIIGVIPEIFVDATLTRIRCLYP